jgi:serine/threonine protein kinase
MYNSKKNILRKNILKKTLKGGKFLGSGSYGCVITPPLPCKSSKLSLNTFKTTTKSKKSKNRNHMSKYVSKIIKYGDEDSYNELNMSSKIKKLDPKQKFFITYESVCKIKKVPDNRNNTEQVKYRNNSLTKYDVINHSGSIKYSVLNNTDKDKPETKCLIDTRLNPMNIIMPYGGYDLFNLKYKINDMNKEFKKTHSFQSNLFIKTYNMVLKNFKEYFKNLVLGLYKLHKSRFVNCDIKVENIMANYNTKTKNIEMRFIDFGFSEHLTHEYCTHYSNIKNFGTTQLLSPEIFITNILYKYIYKNSKMINSKTINSKIITSINENVKEMYVSLKENDYVYKLYNKYTEKNIEHLPIIATLYNDILNQFNNNKVLNHYFGINNVNSLNGYLQKSDVYALGCSMYEFLVVDYKLIDVKNDMQLHNLLKNMIHPDPNKRFNILQCLKHKYFQ